MSIKNETLAYCTRFVSIALLSCLVLTGGMWVYHDCGQIVDGAGSAGKEPGNWFTRWAGVDATKLNDDERRKVFDEHITNLPTKFEIGPELIEQLHKPMTFDWDDR